MKGLEIILIVLLFLVLVAVTVYTLNNKIYSCKSGNCTKDPLGDFASKSACQTYCKPPLVVVPNNEPPQHPQIKFLKSKGIPTDTSEIDFYKYPGSDLRVSDRLISRGGINKSLIKNYENSFNESLGSVTLGAELSSEQREFKFLLWNVSQTAITFAVSVWPEGFELDARERLFCCRVPPVSLEELFAVAAFDMGIFLKAVLRGKATLDENVQFIKYLNDFVTRGREALDAGVSFSSPDLFSSSDWNVDKNGVDLEVALERLYNNSPKDVLPREVMDLLFTAFRTVQALVK